MYIIDPSRDDRLIDSFMHQDPQPWIEFRLDLSIYFY